MCFACNVYPAIILWLCVPCPVKFLQNIFTAKAVGRVPSALCCRNLVHLQRTAFSPILYHTLTVRITCLIIPASIFSVLSSIFQSLSSTFKNFILHPLIIYAMIHSCFCTTFMCSNSPGLEFRSAPPLKNRKSNNPNQKITLPSQ